MVFVCTKERWNKMGNPDLNSKIFLKDRKTSKKVFFTVIGIDYGHKKGIKLTLLKTKNIK